MKQANNRLMASRSSLPSRLNRSHVSLMESQYGFRFAVACPGASSCLRIRIASAPLSTVAERSNFQKTGRYDEVIALCSAFQKFYPKAIRCTKFGRTPKVRPMLALIASHTGALNARDARKRGLPVVLIHGGIHAGEIDGKDAGFLAPA